MAASDRYKQPAAFKAALEQRIRTEAKLTGRTMQRIRQLLLFDRMLARAFTRFGERIVLKGGFALELRVSRARTTRDIDLRIEGSTADLLEALRSAGGLDLGDWFSFVVEPDPEHPLIEGEGAVYTGERFRVRAELGGARYGDPFGLDLGVADVLMEAPEVVPGSGFLEFVGIARPALRIYPRGSHVSEKVHAYTLPRDRPNSRMKDLPDLALLASTGPFEAAQLRAALEATFTFRKTHPLPDRLPEPPDAWSPQYARLARTDGLPWRSLAEALTAVRLFLDPVLAGITRGTWNPGGWAWKD